MLHFIWLYREANCRFAAIWSSPLSDVNKWDHFLLSKGRQVEIYVCLNAQVVRVMQLLGAKLTTVSSAKRRLRKKSRIVQSRVSSLREVSVVVVVVVCVEFVWKFGKSF